MRRQASRVLMVQFILLGGASAVLVAVLLPLLAGPLLLIEPETLEGSARLVRRAALVWMGAVGAYVLYEFWRLRATIRALLEEEPGAVPEDLPRLDRLPARVTTLTLLVAFVLCAATLSPELRPRSLELVGHAQYAILTFALACVATLPSYLVARTLIGRVLEKAPLDIAREALTIATLRARGGADRRLRRRFAVAALASVGLIAVASALLGHAHSRALDESERERDALDLARSIVAPIDGNSSGVQEALTRAAQLGYPATVRSLTSKYERDRLFDGATQLVVPANEQSIIFTLPARPLARSVGNYLLVVLGCALVTVVVAWMLGDAYSSDIALATKRIQDLGVSDLVKGARLSTGARFDSINALLRSVDEVANLFGAFASAQEQAIVSCGAAERSRAMFLASMSHDLKSPLNSILGFAHLLTRADLTHGQAESASIIIQRGRELLYLIETILDAARAEAGELTLLPESQKVAEVLTQTERSARAQLAGFDIDVKTEAQSPSLSVLADSKRLTQALVALVLVAARVVRRGEIVLNTATQENDRVVLRVTAESPDVEIPGNLLEAFHSIEQARKQGSLGLGPWLARTIAEAHGGEIRVVSSSTRVEFSIVLPLGL